MRLDAWTAAARREDLLAAQGPALRALMDLHGVPAREVAILLGVSRPAVQNRLTGVTRMTFAEVAVLCEAFGEPLDRFTSAPVDA